MKDEYKDNWNYLCYNISDYDEGENISFRLNKIEKLLIFDLEEKECLLNYWYVQKAALLQHDFVLHAISKKEWLQFFDILTTEYRNANDRP